MLSLWCRVSRWYASVSYDLCRYFMFWLISFRKSVINCFMFYFRVPRGMLPFRKDFENSHLWWLDY